MGTIKRNFSNNVTPTGKFDSADLTGTIPATNVADASLTNVTSVPATVGDFVQKVASDPTPVGAGDVWYNTTSNALKSVISSEAWSSGANLSLARQGVGGAGTQDAALAISGRTYPAPYVGTPKNIMDQVGQQVDLYLLLEYMVQLQKMVLKQLVLLQVDKDHQVQQSIQLKNIMVQLGQQVAI